MSPSRSTLAKMAIFSATIGLSSCDRPAEPTSSAPASPGGAAQVEDSLHFEIPETVTFNEHIQPILSEYCYHCHGPDEKTRYPEGEPLRLDLAEHAFTPRDNGEPVIIKGDAKASLLVKLIHSTDQESIMPPPESHKELDALQIALLEKWVDQGAEYQDHWSFIPVSRPTIPDTESPWGFGPIDAFVTAKLGEKGLKPNPPQDPKRFYRRLHFDLTGLPPTREDSDAFEQAFANDPETTLGDEVDRLLATSSSAEHFARYWLDAARYADTHGIHIDNYRAIWPYRDWVINAFKSNMPWDQFTIEQIAGDILPDATLDQIVATGFNRCLPTTGEGGAIAKEYEAIYAQDRTDTTTAVWLGLTVGCAACHDHKFDPISQKDTYSFNAFFRNTPMTALDRNKEDHPPNIFVPLKADRPRYKALVAEIKELDQKLVEQRKAARPAYQSWLATATIEPIEEIDSTLSIHLPLIEESGPIHGTVDGEPRQWPADLPRIEAPIGHAPLISKKAIELGDIGSFGRRDSVTYGGFIRIKGKPTGAVIARMDPGQSHRGWDIYLEGGRPVSHVIDSWDRAANKLISNTALEQEKWHHVMFTFNGSEASYKASTLYIDGEKSEFKLKPGRVEENIETDVPLRLGSRHNGDSKLRGGQVAFQDFRLYRRLLKPAEILDLAKNSQLNSILAIPATERSNAQKKTLFNYYVSSLDIPTRKLRKELDDLKTERTKLENRGSISLVMQEKPDSEPFAHILERGVYSDPREKVEANTPASLPPMPEDAPRNRLGLARWLVSADNPLTPRVTMNRLWYQFFGTGIVETVEDFGIMGARPSHPKLLDWLAAEFVASGWDHRHMVKQIVTSAAYRQSATISPEKLEIDPGNRLISRGPRYRLDAEQLRDLALAASDTLSSASGGPPAKPYQPEGVWEAVAMPQSNTRFYKQGEGDALYRRSVYTFWKRTAAPPAMEILNAPTRETFCVRRERTNTPLQAFVTLNDPQFVEACRQLATIAIASGPDVDTRIDLITGRLISRTLAEEERSLVESTLSTAMDTFTADPDAAGELIRIGESEPDTALAAPELAAWTLIASQILNLDETLTK